MAGPWEDYAQPAEPDGPWKDYQQPSAPPEAPTWGNVSEAIPEAFLDRLRAGQALSRIISAAGKQAGEGAAGQTPTGYSDERLAHMIDVGVFHDPLKSRGGPIQMANEAVLFPIAQAWQAITTGINAGIHGAGGAVGQIVEEFGGSQGTANRAKNEVINAGNWAMIEGGMGRFSRPQVEPGVGVTERAVGGLPAEADFANAGKVLESPHAETNLRRMWKEDGITPAEAVHDAQTDAFLRHEITAPREEILLQPRGPEAARLPEYLRAGPAVIETTPLSGRSLFHETSAENAVAMLADDLTNSVDRIRSSNIFVADNPDIAIGQGGSGIRIEFDGDLVSGVEHAKPGTGDLTGREYKANAIGNNAIKSVLVAPGERLSLKPAWQARFDATFDRTNMPDGSTLYERKPPEKLPVVKPAMTAEDFEVLTETGGRPGSLSAAMTEPGMIPLDVQPASPPGSLTASVKAAADTLLDIGRDAQMLVAPMARGTAASMAIAKDFANALRRNRWDWDRIDSDIAKRFTPEQRARMWSAADEESVSRQLGEPAHMREHQGLATLDAAERAAVEDLHTRAQSAWQRAADVGLVEGEGLPAYTPRMVINTAGASSQEAALALNSIGANLKVKTSNMLKRKYLEAQDTEAAAKAKYGDQAALARDIRVLPMATAHLEDAIAGRTLINNIKDYGKRTGSDVVVEGAIPAGSETKWFTLDHPAFRTWRPKLGEVDGKVQALKDAEGNAIFEQVPLYVHGDFEGPLRAVLSHKSGAVYGAMMSLKGKTMSLIMNSPMIHNAVEWGRAVFAMPGKVATFKVYFEGNRAKHDVALMHEAIDNGLVPIGHRFFNQDISGLMESPNLTPGRSWTSKVLAAVPGLFDEAAGVAVKRSIDKAGDFWHNTLLWDRVADLQMGLYTNFRADMMAKGIDQQTSSRIAAHWANRYAGALPKEAMSDGATKMANMLLFSRSFTLGNMGVLKDMMTGLPKDVLAQIERDAGFKAGSIEAGIEAGQQAAGAAKSLARRKAIAVVALDIAGMYVFNSILQNATNVILGDSTVDKELFGYAARLKGALSETAEHPLKLLQPFHFLESLSSTGENEPGRAEKVRIGYAKDGTAIYGRAPVGKIGEEFIGYMTGPLDMMRKKLSTVARPGWQIMSNDAGFGRKVYDPDADTPGKYLNNAYLIAKHMALAQFPEGQLRAGWDLVHGQGDAKVNALQAFGPFAGVTFSKGAPGGPAVGEMYASRSQQEFKVNQALPDIRKQIQRGDIAGAMDRMTELDIPSGLQLFYVKTTLDPALRLSPRATRDFYLHSTPEQRARFERALTAPPQP